MNTHNNYTKLSTNFNTPKRKIRALNGVNLGPISMNGFLDLSELHRELKIPQTRLHDCPYSVADAVDIHCIFPHFDDDIDDPRNYNFAVSDDYIQSILDVGSAIVFRLGETIEHHKMNKYHIHPPKDYTRWARICVNIIRHYNQNWANGFTHNIKYWEIWNEAWGDNCWTGTQDEWMDFYAVTSKIIKAHDPTLKIGGPTADGGLQENPDPNNFAATFLNRCKKDKLPLDFYSWHNYSDRPEHILNDARSIRSGLDALGFTDCEIHLNEWNYHPRGDWSWQHDRGTWGKEIFLEAQSEIGASFDAALLIGMQDSPIDVANFYWAKEGWWGLFDAWGAPQKNYYAFLAFAQMLDTPERVACTNDSETEGTFILGAINKAQDTAQVLISCFRSENDRLELLLEGFPWSEQTRYCISVVDKNHNLEVVRRGVIDHDKGEKSMKMAISQHSVMLISFTPLKHKLNNTHKIK